MFLYVSRALTDKTTYQKKYQMVNKIVFDKVDIRLERTSIKQFMAWLVQSYTLRNELMTLITPYNKLC